MPAGPGVPAPSPARRAAFAAGLAALTLLGTVGGAEVVVRLLAGSAAPSYGYAPTNPYRFDPTIGWRHGPSSTFTWSQPEFSIAFETNAQGFRSSRPYVPSGAGQKVVALLGDSFVQAIQVPEEETFARLLEQELGPGVQVQNYGVSNYGLVHMLQVYRHGARELRPDVVVACINANDFQDSFPGLHMSGFPSPRYRADGGGIAEVLPFDPRAARLLDPVLAIPDPPLAARARLGLRRWSALYRWSVRHRLRAELMDMGFPTEAFIYEEPPHPPWLEVERTGTWCLEQLGRECAAAGTPLLLVVVPRNWDVDPALWEKLVRAYGAIGGRGSLEPGRVAATIAGVGARLDAGTVDLTPVFRERGGAGLFFRGDLHWNAAGHRVAAAQLAAPVEALLEEAATAGQPAPP